MQRAPVTGASRGIGRVLVVEQAGRRLEVVATARRVDNLAGLPASQRLPLEVTSDASMAAAANAAGGRPADKQRGCQRRRVRRGHPGRGGARDVRHHSGRGAAADLGFPAGHAAARRQNAPCRWSSRTCTTTAARALWRGLSSKRFSSTGATILRIRPRAVLQRSGMEVVVTWLEILRLVLRHLHLVGFAMLFGGFLVLYLTGTYRVNVVMGAGLGTMILTGLVLAAPFPRDEDLKYVKLAVKLGIAVLIGALFGVAVTRERRGAAIHRSHFLTIGTLILLTAAVAVFWQ